MAEKGYFRRVLKQASFDKLRSNINAAHERSGKSKLAIFLDMAWSFVRYGAGYYDYLIFAFYNLKAKERKTYVTDTPAKDVQEAILRYETMGKAAGLTMVRIYLETGRTHQIRAQFSSRNLPLVGDRKYSLLEDNCEIALWSAEIGFIHPKTGERMKFSAQPPKAYPWTEF